MGAQFVDDPARARTGGEHFRERAVLQPTVHVTIQAMQHPRMEHAAQRLRLRHRIAALDRARMRHRQCREKIAMPLLRGGESQRLVDRLVDVFHRQALALKTENLLPVSQRVIPLLNQAMERRHGQRPGLRAGRIGRRRIGELHPGSTPARAQRRRAAQPWQPVMTVASRVAPVSTAMAVISAGM